jgi:hypothetical protein
VTTREWKVIGAAVVAVAIAFAAGWVWGSAGGRTAERELQGVRLQQALTEARSRILAARVDLYRLNFGSAATNLEEAKAPLEDAAAAFDGRREEERAAAVRRAIASAEEARRLAAQVDQAAQGAAERALDDIQRAH